MNGIHNNKTKEQSTVVGWITEIWKSSIFENISKYCRKCYFLVIYKYYVYMCKHRNWFNNKSYFTLHGNFYPNALNSLLPEFFISSFFGIYPKIVSFNLPTHRRDAHGKCLWWSLPKLKSQFWLNVLYMTR